jgi:hypothetical protein
MSKSKEYYQVGKRLGLNQKEIKYVLNQNINNTNQSNQENGPIPPMYRGGFYSSHSIKDFYF